MEKERKKSYGPRKTRMRGVSFGKRGVQVLTGRRLRPDTIHSSKKPYFSAVCRIWLVHPDNEYWRGVTQKNGAADIL